MLLLDLLLDVSRFDLEFGALLGLGLGRVREGVEGVILRHVLRGNDRKGFGCVFFPVVLGEQTIQIY